MLILKKDFHYDTLLRSVLKPGRYTGGEYGQTVKENAECRFAFAFPDTYEIGMSNLGIRILYGALNSNESIVCERVYAPWTDMQEGMEKYGIPLCSCETNTPLDEFDFIGFTLQYELCYTNVLNMLSLSHLPVLASERGEDQPIIIGGGPCTYNAEPLCDFFDIFSIGEGEEALPELCRLYISMKKSGEYTKSEFLHRAARLEGFYVPSLYEVVYNSDGTIKEYKPKYDDIPKKIRKRIIKDMDKGYFPESFVMPYIETVHDRIVLETGRGCVRGCRFCQAGMIYRPIREKSPETLNEQAKTLYKNTGYDEISLCSLSISDYSRLRELTELLLPWCSDNMISLSLPSQRADAFSAELLEKVSAVRQTGLTFAPEAGTQRLRNVINKNLEESEITNAVRTAFEGGRDRVKLYFMCGLPTETLEDIEGIYAVADRVADEFYAVRRKGKPAVTASVSCFVPKPFTAFQWEGQDSVEEFEQKQKHLLSVVKNKHIKLDYHDARVSHLEAVFARGDRQLGKALLEAHRRGVKFDAWNDFFDYDVWTDIFKSVGIDPSFYAQRVRREDEVFPWDIIDCGISKDFLLRERHRAYEEATTPDCMHACAGCGAAKLGGKCTWCKGSSK